jgi:hypothetical protein
MRILEGRFATTQADGQGVQAAADALIGMAEAINAQYIPFMTQHDPRLPPVGRMVDAHVEETDGGHFALVGTVQLWDENDSADELAGDGRRIVSLSPTRLPFELGIDLPAQRELGTRALTEIARLAGPQAKLRYDAKKSLDPLSAIVLGAGVFAISGIASGFLQRLGEDIYVGLKRRLLIATQPRQGGDRLIQFQCGVQGPTGIVTVDLILANPSEDSIAFLLGDGLHQLDTLVRETIAAHPRAAKVTAQIDGPRVRLLYWVRDDGVPTPLRILSSDELTRYGGLSIGGVAEYTDRPPSV